MSNKYWKLVNRVIAKSDLLILVLDARFIEESRNSQIEEKVRSEKKPLIYAITKSDLVDRKKLEKIALNPSVFISIKQRMGTTLLRDRILIEGKKAYKGKETFVVGVLGYPNVGKSSLINAMKGRKSAPTSSVSGFTKSVQKIKAFSHIIFLDTPGVIPQREIGNTNLAIIGSIDYNRVKDPDVIVINLLKKYPGKIEDYYKVLPNEDLELVLEVIAKKSNMFMKGSIIDIERVSRMILKDWQCGKIR